MTIADQQATEIPLQYSIGTEEIKGTLAEADKETIAEGTMTAMTAGGKEGTINVTTEINPATVVHLGTSNLVRNVASHPNHLDIPRTREGTGTEKQALLALTNSRSRGRELDFAERLHPSTGLHINQT